MKDIAALFKVRLGFFVVMSAILGWFMAVESGPQKFAADHWWLLADRCFKRWNQVIENADGLMERTAERPLPSGRMEPWQAILYSVLAGIIGLGCLFTLNPLSGWLGVAALVSYAFIYTPLKSRSTSACLLGPSLVHCRP